MVAIITRAPAGFPGRISRADSKTIVPEVIDSNTPPTAYGGVVKIVSGKLQPIASGDAATVIYGFLVNAYPMQSTSNTISTPATPPTSGIIDVLRRGYMTVKLAQGTSAKRGQVYVRVTADTGKNVGDIETAADSGKCIAVSGAYFTGPADSNSVVEIEYNI